MEGSQRGPFSEKAWLASEPSRGNREGLQSYPLPGQGLKSGIVPANPGSWHPCDTVTGMPTARMSLLEICNCFTVTDSKAITNFQKAHGSYRAIAA